MGILLPLVRLKIFFAASACGRADILLGYMINSVFPVNKASVVGTPCISAGLCHPKPQWDTPPPSEPRHAEVSFTFPLRVMAIYQFHLIFPSLLVSLIPYRYFMAQQLASLSLSGRKVTYFIYLYSVLIRSYTERMFLYYIANSVLSRVFTYLLLV